MAGSPKVVVVGGGFAGLESAFLLRMRLDDRVDITLVSDRGTWVFKPNSIYIPFGAEPDSLLVDLAHPLRKRQIGFLETRVREGDPDRRLVAFENGSSLPYDFLVLATGSGMRPEEIPGASRWRWLRSVRHARLVPALRGRRGLRRVAH